MAVQQSQAPADALLSRPPPSSRGRRITPHTADVGIEAWATDLGALFEESAEAVARIGADMEGDPPAAAWEVIALEAADLPAMAFAWLNELIGLCDVHHAALVAVSVDRLSLTSAPDGRACWSLRARAGFRPFGGRDVRPRCQIKSATFHRLSVRRDGDTWTLSAYLDV